MDYGCGFVNLGYGNLSFTWCNNMWDGSKVWERLDWVATTMDIGC